jgi:hypothetical protein
LTIFGNADELLKFFEANQVLKSRCGSLFF